MKLKSSIMDETAVRRALARMTHEIIEKNNGTSDLCLLGVHRRGVPLARELAANLEKFEGVQVPLGRVNISLYRDDLSELTNCATLITNQFLLVQMKQCMPARKPIIAATKTSGGINA